MLRHKAFWGNASLLFPRLSSIRKFNRNVNARFPLYFATIVVLLLWPTMTVNWAAFIAVSTAYFYLGSTPEEEKLVEEFGDAYRRY